MSASPRRRRLYPAIKRGIDVIGAVLLLIVASPLLVIAFAAIWLDSGRPLIHRRHVVGLGGREFDAFKLRTMVVDADRWATDDPRLSSLLSASAKAADDPRVTRAGRWLRRTSIDEIPQLINVVRGEMSLVGPRMITAAELEAWGTVRGLLLTVRPGLTGSWQVSGRQTLSRDARIGLDADYVRRMCFTLDVRILVRTLPAVISGRGAL